MAPRDTGRGAGMLGLGAAACAACCVGPLITFLAAAGLLTATAFVSASVVGLLVAVPLAVWIRRRRNARSRCTGGIEPAPVEIGSRPARLTGSG